MKMNAILMRAFGGPDVLSYESVDRPEPGPTEVLVKVASVSVNRTFDLAAREGRSPHKPPLPHILGVDPAGTIVAAGAEVDPARVGERVYVSLVGRCGDCAGCEGGRACTRVKRIGMTEAGGYAQYLAAPAFQARTLSANIDFAEAGVICRHAGAARAEMRTANVKKGDRVLVMAAAGALGSFLIQLAKLEGAEVIAVASSDDRLAACRALGADHAVDYKSTNLTEEVMRITQGYGVDVVFENVSDPAVFPLAFACLAYGGRLVTIGYHGGGTVPVDMKALFLKQLCIRSSGMWTADEDGVGVCLDLAAKGRLKALIGARLPLAQAAQAHRLVESGSVVGKVILEPHD